MTDPLRSLFMPLTLAVGFAMISSYVLSIMCLPILCVYLLKHKAHGEKKRGLFDRMLDGVWPGRGMAGPPALVGGPGLPRGVCPDPLGGGVAARHRVVPAGRFGRVRAAVPAAARLELRADATDGGEVPPGDRGRGEGQEHQNHDGLRRPGRPELRHRQHGPLHARAGRRPTARRPPRGQRHQARRVSRAAPQGPARTGLPLDGQPAGTGRTVPRGGDAASRDCRPSASSRATS